MAPWEEINAMLREYTRPNPYSCICRGGWVLSDYDSWHKCPRHYLAGTPQPDDEGDLEDSPEVGPAFDRELDFFDLCQAAFVELTEHSQLPPEVFRAEVRAIVGTLLEPGERPLLRHWLAAAEQVAESAWTDAAEDRARDQGYSCRLEAVLVQDGKFEARCRVEGLDIEAEQYGPLTADRDSWYPHF